MSEHEHFMRRAIALARAHMETGEGGPFGAVIVRDGKVLAEGWNRVTSTCDPTAHAEVEAIRKACEKINNFSLQGSVLYTSCEPCPMCLGAIYWARLDRFFYAASGDDAARAGFDDRHIYEELAKPPTARSLPAVRLLADEGAAVFEAWIAKPDKVPY